MQINAKIAEAKTRHDYILSELKKTQAELERSYDEQIAAELEPIIKEGQKLEKQLQDKKGKAAKKTMVFEVTGDQIIEAGVEIGAKHISQVQKIVQKKLEENGHIYAQSSLSPALIALTKKKCLRRMKEKKGWVYVRGAANLGNKPRAQHGYEPTGNISESRTNHERCSR